MFGKLRSLARNVAQRISPPPPPRRSSTPPPEEVLDATVSQVSFLTSHNTYLDGIQILSTSSVQPIVNAIKMGVRCIELDVFPGRNNEVIVGHGIPKAVGNLDLIATTTIPFESAIKAIAENAFVGTSLPLFICIENNTECNEAANNRMADVIKQHLGDFLVQNRDVPNTKVRDLQNKIVIMTGGGGIGRFLDLVNVFWSDPNVCNISSQRDVPVEAKLCRVYPCDSVQSMFSENFDGVRYIDAGANFVAMNTQNLDGNLIKVTQRLQHRSVIKVR